MHFAGSKPKPRSSIGSLPQRQFAPSYWTSSLLNADETRHITIRRQKKRKTLPEIARTASVVPLAVIASTIQDQQLPALPLCLKSKYSFSQ